MNRLKSFIACLGMTAASACLADAPAFCTSLCESRQRECRASAQVQPAGERALESAVTERNPLARTAQGEVPGQGTRALGAAGDTNRRMDRLGACDTSYQRCTRSCAAQDSVKTVKGA